MRKMGDQGSALVRCREADEALVKELLEPARAAYKKAFGSEAPALSVDAGARLAPAPKGDGGAGDEGATW